MKDISSTLVRFRLVNSTLLLILMLAALAVDPVVRASGCDYVCAGWNAKNGCTTCNYCCVNSDGSYSCKKVQNSDCGLGGEQLID